MKLKNLKNLCNSLNILADLSMEHQGDDPFNYVFKSVHTVVVEEKEKRQNKYNKAIKNLEAINK